MIQKQLNSHILFYAPNRKYHEILSVNSLRGVSYANHHFQEIVYSINFLNIVHFVLDIQLSQTDYQSVDKK